MEKKELFKIFGKDIFENKQLLPIMKDLVEKGRVKPFECVGTKKETKEAFELCLEKANRYAKKPYLLAKLNR